MARSRKRTIRQAPEGFTRKPSRPCPDCLLRNDLDMLGRPLKDMRGRVKDCGGCGGKATVPRDFDGDPMWLGR